MANNIRKEMRLEFEHPRDMNPPTPKPTTKPKRDNVVVSTNRKRIVLPRKRD